MLILFLILQIFSVINVTGKMKIVITMWYYIVLYKNYTYFFCFAAQSSCITKGGKNPFKPCIFPFSYKGVKYFGCPKDLFDPTERWCSTKVDSRGVHVDGEGEYGFCSSNCPIHEDGISTSSLISSM